MLSEAKHLTIRRCHAEQSEAASHDRSVGGISPSESVRLSKAKYLIIENRIIYPD